MQLHIQQVHSVTDTQSLTSYPLHPDDIISIEGRGEILQVVQVVGLHAVGVVPQVTLMGMENELLRHVQHLHGFKYRKQNPFGHPANPTATIKGPLGVSLPRSLIT